MMVFEKSDFSLFSLKIHTQIFIMTPFILRDYISYEKKNVNI